MQKGSAPPGKAAQVAGLWRMGDPESMAKRLRRAVAALHFAADLHSRPKATI